MITINEQSSIKLNIGKIIYVDPYHLKDSSHDADIILITHSHYDHFSIEDILKCKKEDTIIVSVGDTYGKLSPHFKKDHIIIVKPNEKLSILGVTIETVPAYNKDKPHHQKEYEWVGYLVTVNEKKYYFMGDTDVLDFMKTISCNHLFIPIGGTYTMTITEAVDLVNEMSPKIVTPIHYGTIVGDKTLGKEFSEKIHPSIECQLLLDFIKEEEQ